VPVTTSLATLRSRPVVAADWPGRVARERVELQLPDAALGRLRVALHAVWDVLASVALLAHSRSLPQFPYRVWARTAMVGLVRGPGADLLRWGATWPKARPPRFLLLSPPPGGCDLDAGRQQLLATVPREMRQRVRAEFPGGVPEPFRGFVTDPERAIGNLCDAIEVYYEVAFKPYWSAIQTTLQDEIRHRGEMLAARSVDGLLSDLHTRIRWSRPKLSIATDVPDIALEPTSEVILVPLLFAREQVLLSDSPAGSTCLGYQARGAAILSTQLDGDPEAGPDRLSVLLGRSRASVMRHLATPRTTTALADMLGLAPSTISEHLALLVSSAAALRFRRANKVYYQLSDAGRGLLRDFCNLDDGAASSGESGQDDTPSAQPRRASYL